MLNSIVITTIDFDTILTIWKNHLWINRTSAIEPTSAMTYLGGYDLKNMGYTPTFFAYYVGDTIAGVNSGHMCFVRQYRSRGLYVFPEYRKKGIGTELLLASVEQAKLEKAKFVWSYPRFTAKNTYEQAGFTIASSWQDSEFGMNAYYKVDI